MVERIESIYLYSTSVEASGKVHTNLIYLSSPRDQTRDWCIELPSSYPLSYFTDNRIRENPVVTPCFDLYRPSSTGTSADMVSLKEH